MKPQNIGTWHRSPGTALLLPEAWLACWHFKVAELKVHNGYSCFEVLFLSSLVPIMRLRSQNHHVSGWSSRHSVCESWVGTHFAPVVGLLRGHLVFKKRYIFSSSKPLTHNVWSLRWKGENVGHNFEQASEWIPCNRSQVMKFPNHKSEPVNNFLPALALVFVFTGKAKHVCSCWINMSFGWVNLTNLQICRGIVHLL